MMPNKQRDCTILGITGGVGAGKSTVMSVLQEEYGAYLIRADEVGHRLREPGGPVFRFLVSEYGTGILNEQGTLNTEAVAALAFSSPENAARLNAGTHPLIRDAILDEIRQKSSSHSLIALEAALLSEGGLLELCDTVLYVYAPRKVRIERLMQDRGYSREKCLLIMQRQKTDKAFRLEADTVILNSGTREDVERQVARKLKRICNCSEPGANP